MENHKEEHKGLGKANNHHKEVEVEEASKRKGTFYLRKEVVGEEAGELLVPVPAEGSVNVFPEDNEISIDFNVTYLMF